MSISSGGRDDRLGPDQPRQLDSSAGLATLESDGHAPLLDIRRAEVHLSEAAVVGIRAESAGHLLRLVQVRTCGVHVAGQRFRPGRREVNHAVRLKDLRRRQLAR